MLDANYGKGTGAGKSRKNKTSGENQKAMTATIEWEGIKQQDPHLTF
jgi:hypothetical protein